MKPNRFAAAGLMCAAFSGGCAVQSVTASHTALPLSVGAPQAERAALFVEPEVATSGEDAADPRYDARWSGGLRDGTIAELKRNGFRVVESRNDANAIVRLSVNVSAHPDGLNHVGDGTAILSISIRDMSALRVLGDGEANAYQYPAPEMLGILPAKAVEDLLHSHLLGKRLAELPAVRPSAVTAVAAAAVQPGPQGGTVTATTPPPAPVAVKLAHEPGAPLTRGAPQPGVVVLAIGIDHYRDLPAATGAHNDASRFAEVARATLGARDENVRVALDDRAGKADIETQLAWAKEHAQPGGRIVLYFSGHGAPDPSTGTPYIVPYDANPSALGTTALRMDKVLAELAESRASEVVAFFDSCFSGSGGRSVLPKGARPLVHVAEPTARAKVVLFSAASGSEISGPASSGAMGLFSETVIDALGSAQADADGDGAISLKELADWVTPRVARAAIQDGRQQHPSVTMGKGMAAPGSFVVARGLAP